MLQRFHLAIYVFHRDYRLPTTGYGIDPAEQIYCASGTIGPSENSRQSDVTQQAARALQLVCPCARRAARYGRLLLRSSLPQPESIPGRNASFHTEWYGFSFPLRGTP